MTLAALEATLRLYRDPDRLAQRLPTLKLLTRSEHDIAAQAERLCPVVADFAGETSMVSIEPAMSQIGSGALPIERFASAALVVRYPGKRPGKQLATLEARLRGLPQSVIGRIADDALRLDLRCLDVADEALRRTVAGKHELTKRPRVVVCVTARRLHNTRQRVIKPDGILHCRVALTRRENETRSPSLPRRQRCVCRRHGHGPGHQPAALLHQHLEYAADAARQGQEARGHRRGGWGGISAAKHLKLNDPNLEVVVLERNPVFFSCPMSNKWLVDIVNAEYLTQSYLKTADKFGYTFVQTEVTGFERDKKRVITAQGWIDYDYLIVAAGIRYNYETWFGNDRRAADYTKANYPAAYIPTAEHFTLKRGIQEFKGGDLVDDAATAAAPLPALALRARLPDRGEDQGKIKGRVIILDLKESPRPITEGFQEAFANLYKDQITYVPKAVIKEVDPFNKKIVTSAGDFRFDHSILMAPHQAGDMAWKAGTIGRNAEGKPTGWAGVDPLFLNLKDDPDTYVIGDAVGVVSPQFNFYPKAGHVANAHGKIVARYIADRAAGRQPKADLPDNLCFMMVNLDPIEDIAVRLVPHQRAGHHHPGPVRRQLPQRRHGAGRLRLGSEDVRRHVRRMTHAAFPLPHTERST